MSLTTQNHPPRIESGEALAQIAQGHRGCPILGSAQDQVRWGPWQPDLVGDKKPVVGGVLELNDHYCPLQLKLFYHSIIQ